MYCGSECDEDLDMVSWPSRPGGGMASCYSYNERGKTGGGVEEDWMLALAKV